VAERSSAWLHHDKTLLNLPGTNQENESNNVELSWTARQTDLSWQAWSPPVPVLWKSTSSRASTKRYLEKRLCALSFFLLVQPPKLWQSHSSAACFHNTITNASWQQCLGCHGMPPSHTKTPKHAKTPPVIISHRFSGPHSSSFGSHMKKPSIGLTDMLACVRACVSVF